MIDTNKIMVPALFLHIQKTAGTSIVKMAASHYGSSNVSSHGDFVGRSPEEFASTSFVSGHFGFDFAKGLMPGRFSFTFLRDPVERVLSFYYFCRYRDPEELPIYRIANDLDLDGFLHAAADNELVRRRIWNSQVWRLASGPSPSGTLVDSLSPDEMLSQALANLEAFSHIGFTETFDADAAFISQALHFAPDVKPAKENVTTSRAMTRDISASTISLIEELTQLDRKLYDAVWQSRKPAPSLAVRQ